MSDMIQICPERDTVCPHGLGCPYAINGHQCAPNSSEKHNSLIDRGIAKIVGVDFGKEGGDLTARVEMERNSDGTWRVVKMTTERHGG